MFTTSTKPREKFLQKKSLYWVLMPQSSNAASLVTESCSLRNELHKIRV